MLKVFDIIKIYIFLFVVINFYHFVSGAAGKIRYISTEHPRVISINLKYLTYANLTSQRYGRFSPVYYVGLHYNTLVTFDENVIVDFQFYEFLTNVYKPSFVRMHHNFCDLVHKNLFFGSAMKQGKLVKPCPYPPIGYISTERPHVTYFNSKYFSHVNITSQRYGRSSPFYYVGLHFDIYIPITNNVQIDFYFYEFLSNQYKRSFVQMHFGWCDMIHKDPFFGAPMRQGKFDQPCPYPPGDYHLYNMTVPVEQIPRSFPFKKGRIYANVTILTGPKLKIVETLVNAQIDMEIKEFKRNKNHFKN